MVKLRSKLIRLSFNMNTNLLYAVGRKDSQEKLLESRILKKDQEFEADELTYNFKTKRPLSRILLQSRMQGYCTVSLQSFLKMEHQIFRRSTYSTCDADTPHFYINLPKARVYPGKKIISGPGNLVLEGIPFPLVNSIRIFSPYKQKKQHQELLIPRIWRREAQRVIHLTDGGYYFAISDYFDLTLKGKHLFKWDMDGYSTNKL